MKRVYEARAYQTPSSCWWDETVPPPETPCLPCDQTADVAIIGAGFTGLNAALALATAGRDVIVLDAEHPGWGASRRNGGFCCLGGARANSAYLARMYGDGAGQDWPLTERAAVEHVWELLDTYNIDADVHSDGETLMAHSTKAMAHLRNYATEAERSYGTPVRVFEAGDLQQMGLNGRFHGGATIPIGFALNPAKYHDGLLQTVQTLGVKIFGKTPVTAIGRNGSRWCASTPNGRVTADTIVVATNGYSSEDIPDWLRARFLPVQSSIIVTRPVSKSEQERQGWTSAQMCYDTRILLHYFRLMPDGRFLFGMRGGRRATPTCEAALSRKIRSDFHRMFPEWRDIDIAHEWSGLVCLMRSFVPFAGPIPDMPGVFAAMGYHGNGVAMGSYLGACLADQVLDLPKRGPSPAFLTVPPKRFPLGMNRRALLAPSYAFASLLDY